MLQGELFYQALLKAYNDYVGYDFNRLRDVFVYDPQAPMIFSSGIFLWLFAAFILVYLLLQRRLTARLLFVTAFSYYFYYKSSGTYFFLLALVTVSDFFIARFMAGTSVGWKLRQVLCLALLLILVCLHTSNILIFWEMSSFAGRRHVPSLRYIPPCGYFFFTFQSLSYTIEFIAKI